MDISNSNCSEMEQALDAYLDLELEPDDAQAVERHLASCPSCTVRLAELEDLVSKLQALPAPVLSRDLADAVGDRILAQKTAPTPVESSGQVVDIASARRSRTFSLSRPLAYAASFILVALAGSYFIGGVNIASRDAVTSQTQIASTAGTVVTTPDVSSPSVNTPSVNTPAVSATTGSAPTSAASSPLSVPVATLPIVANSSTKSQAIKSPEAVKIASLPSSSSSSSSNSSKTTISNNNILAKPAEAEDLIADYGEPAVDGINDFGISTNEDGLYAIKL